MTLQYQGTLTPDVLVCGGGCAGIGATLGAARSGVSTLLVERAGFAGGILTSVGLPYFDGIADIGTDRIVTRGVALELFSRMGGCEPDATSHPPAQSSDKQHRIPQTAAGSHVAGRAQICPSCTIPSSVGWNVTATALTQ